MLKVYLCGPTVYNYVHIGNLRPIISYDLMLKAARALDIKFKFIHNITDIDDKIIAKAQNENLSEAEVAQKFSKDYINLLVKFNVDTITNLEFVTQNLDYINNFIAKLVDNNCAYELDNNIWFNTWKYQNIYGNISGQKLEHMAFEASNFIKNNQADFALWKKTDSGIKYTSSFGQGRPGWHTECVALIEKHFGKQGVDLHGGGMDLTFPHHENENIQFYALYHKNLAAKWLRSGQINLNNVKMSKSLNNIIFANDFINKYSPDHFKLILLLNSFTSIINLDDNLINNVEILLKRITKIYFNEKLANLKSNNYNQEIYLNLMQNIYQLKFATFIKTINDLIKEINLNQDIILINTLIKAFDTLGFDFKKLDFDKYAKIYWKWQTLLKAKEYQKADELRAVLRAKKLV
ncbi:cysteine--tRNA ligase [Mycoplasmopsis bovirhinis]|uniref:class I tRNA ligase family protein n=1 Tax=Mycoplasmopsis bovirhinis TaxID=29553 RepID=UPI000BB9F10B|nr:class I tRNA ligase family protein [Mycoplasmopsis bovirhinis]BBA22378.1 cysteine--tRNA ligase [Mycoplasmopsis bovirhinis]